MVDAASASESEEHNSTRGDGDETKEKSKPRAKSPNGTERVIDHVALAAMLREAANFVEKNEFDPVLYQTVQDFRAYYKHHQPKKQTTRRRRKKSGSHTTGNASAAEDTAEAKPPPPRESEAMNGDSGPTHPAPTSASASERPMGATSWAYSATPEANPTARTEETDRPDPPAAAETAIPVKMKSSDNTPVATVEPKIDREMSSPSTVMNPSPSAIAKNAAAAVFGNLKFPKIHVPVPNPAFVATSKKNAQRAKADLEEFTASAATAGVPQAVSSARRKSAHPDASSTSMPPPQNGYEGEWCEEHFTMGCACKVRKNVDIGTDGKPSSQRSVHAGRTNGASPPVPSSSTVMKTASATTTTRPEEQDDLPYDEIPRTTTASGTANAAASSTTNHHKPASSEPTMQQPHQPQKPPYQRPINPNSTLIANGWIEQQRRSKMRTVWKEVLASLVAGRKPGEETTLWIQREVTNSVSGKKELEALHQVPIKWLQEVTHLDYATDNRFSLRVYNIQEEYLFRCTTDQAAKNWVQTLHNAQEAVQGPRHNSSKTKLDGWDSLPPRSEASSFDDEKKGNDPQTYPSSHPRHPQPQSDAAPRQNAGMPPPQPEPTQQPRMTIRELRAICHGAGVNTMGMERTELEAAAAEVRARGTYFAGPSSAGPVPTASATTTKNDAMQQEEMTARQEASKRRQEMEAAEELRRREEEAKELKRRKEEERRRAEEERRRLEEEARRRVEEERRQAEEEAHRRRADEEMRRRQAEEEHRRRVAEQERLKQLAEEQRRQQQEAVRAQQEAWQQQQQQWQKQQQEEQERRRRVEMEQQQAAEQRRRQQEAFKKWQQQQQQQHHHTQPQQHQQQNWHHQQQHQQQQPHQQHHQQQQWNQYQQQQQRHQQQHQQQQSSAASAKWASANQSNDGPGETTRIKHEILIHWALQPPQLQMLRPIDALITTIQTVFPPALGVSGHDYFSKWTPFARNDLVDETGRPDDAKLKKAVRKLRFFLHPDKLPRDLSAEQQFMVKMLWDVTNDAWEEFHKRAEDLDWLNK